MDIDYTKIVFLMKGIYFMFFGEAREGSKIQ